MKTLLRETVGAALFFGLAVTASPQVEEGAMPIRMTDIYEAHLAEFRALLSRSNSAVRHE
ncbi:MAG: hypothetical protein HN919_08880 [Verrucomicrobia bacterium]|jgi:hypothetical protein|nr:hypothetical protein [Verrucomicrobiota bacterium]MBT7066402.1 hypothetical protein [Verrucomicrobiota bacterium]MBT7701278.1 hypothetical protein [Verrucomicrobiota bacterium]